MNVCGKFVIVTLKIGANTFTGCNQKWMQKCVNVTLKIGANTSTGCIQKWMQKCVNVTFEIGTNTSTHVLVHFVKSISAYTVKSSSTLFSDNIQ